MERIFISTSTFGEFSDKPLTFLQSMGYKVDVNPFGRKLQPEESLRLYSPYAGIIAGTEQFTREVLDAAPNLRVISRVGVGLDNVDLEYASSKGILVYRTQTEPSFAVAELALGLILDLVRKISLHNQWIKNGVWKKSMGVLLSGKTLGIIGLGKIGRALAQLTEGFSLKYLAFDVVQDAEFAKSHGVIYVGLDELLGASDIVSIHLRSSPELLHLLSDERLKKMKRGAILVNTSRGDLIDEKALEKALSEGIIAGVGLDVFEQEPYEGPLMRFDNVVLTSHIGGYAKEVRVAMELEAAHNLVKGLKERS